MLTADRVIGTPSAVVIDLRSPGEYAVDHLPGAFNVPLFSDTERAVVGLLYKKSSPNAAFERGLEHVLEGIEALVAKIAVLGGIELETTLVRGRVLELAGDGMDRLRERLEPVILTQVEACASGRPVVLHCWRGGLRSLSVVALFARLGIPQVVGMEGGYHAYRKHVMAELESWVPPRTLALRGLTGVGKTLVLREIERLRPGSTIDLEAAAGHRSSLLGMVGLQPVSQKAFDTNLALRTRELEGGVLVVEGESRKVGDVTVPKSIWLAMQAAENILLEADQESRITTLLDDYLSDASSQPKLREQLALVEKRMNLNTPLLHLFDTGRLRELAAVLLEDYYDPLYRHSEKGKSYCLQMEASDPARAAIAICLWLEGKETE